MFYVLCLVRCFSCSLYAAQVCRSPALCLSPQSMAILGKWVWRNDSFYSSTVTGLMRVTLQGSVIFWLSAEKSAPTRWSSTSEQGPNPIREQYFHGGMKMAKVNLKNWGPFYCSATFFVEKGSFAMISFSSLFTRGGLYNSWRRYPIAFPFISMAIS